MPLLSTIKSLVGRRSSAQPPVSDQSDEVPASESSVPSSSGNGRGKQLELKNSIARGAAEGTARETVRRFFEQLLGD
ncbi:hypothetical protein ADK70_31290 [Streptomyces rimosus subsp. pseudoverticillatus]|uniref:hypothetical protein n=1 Tax=Streptomyces rimosus TaxID=1927 RepID=UPI0006B2A46E|nr:hypothetical protein [Streptomyces rimosus]KOT79258.1 hypothetical protein ADK70_31290 [Streptomyces rimosus subsp. pseudoverticillatus]